MIRQILFTALALGVPALAGAISPSAPQLVSKDASQIFHPVLSPDGVTLLYSSQDHTGLNAMNLSDGSTFVIDESAAAGFSPVFSTDGMTVVYRTADIIDGLTYRDVRSFSMADDVMLVIRPMSRNDEDLNGLAGTGTYAYADYKDIQLCVDGRMSRLSPLADAHSYLWASVSPDGRHLLFTEPFTGVYVSNLDGSDARRIAAKGDYAAWADDNTVVYIESKDDGYVIVSSRLRAYDLDTAETMLISPVDQLVGEATAAAGRVVYSTLDGKLYTLTIK